MSATVKTAEDLRRLSLSTGAEVVHADGRRFNASGKRVAALEPAPAPARASPPDPNAPLLAAIAAQTEAIDALTAAVGVNTDAVLRALAEQKRAASDQRDLIAQVRALTKPAPAQAPMTPCSFEFERDDNGFIKRIRKTRA